MANQGQATRLLLRYKSGEEDAFGELMTLLYAEVHQLAQFHMQKEYRKGHTLGATALVNEAFLKLVNQQSLEVSQRSEFMAVASRIMRNILVDHARARSRLKRGGGMEQVPLSNVEFILGESEVEEILALDEAIDRLATINERAAQIIQYRFYGGLTLDETADLLGISVKTVQRTWKTARAWLRNEVGHTLPA